MKVKILHRCKTPTISLTAKDHAQHAKWMWKCPICKQKWIMMAWPTAPGYMQKIEAIRWGRLRYLKRKKEEWYT